MGIASSDDDLSNLSKSDLVASIVCRNSRHREGRDLKKSSPSVFSERDTDN